MRTNFRWHFYKPKLERQKFISSCFFPLPYISIGTNYQGEVGITFGWLFFVFEIDWIKRT